MTGWRMEMEILFRCNRKRLECTAATKVPQCATDDSPQIVFPQIE